MNAVVFAYHDMGCLGITALIKAGFAIEAIITHIDEPKEKKFFSSVEHFAAKYDIAIFAPNDVNHPLWVARIKDLSPDVIFSFYYRKIICQEILSIPRIGAFNLHGSLLPLYRGCSPLNWVLVNGENKTGVTLHRMIARADAGAILAQHSVAITQQDDALTLHRKMCVTASKLLKNVLPKILENSFNETLQDDSIASYVNRRNPEDGRINWSKSAVTLVNLIRAVTDPWPGAFSYFCNKKFIIWKAHVIPNITYAQPGTVISTNPLVIACGIDSIEIETGQNQHGLYMRGWQLAQSLGVVKGSMLINTNYMINHHSRTSVLILGVNGFIGNHLTEYLLQERKYEIYGLDINTDAINRFIANPLFHFFEGDISIHSEWLEYHIKKCDIILPLVAIATPIEYIRNPIRVFEIDFEENLKIIRYCVKYKKRIIFPSTSEVYGMCTDQLFDEYNSNLIVGPINKQRWIYSASKQLLDRIIWAYGEKEGLKFTLFRPFNWIGPRLDNLNAARIGSSRVITQLILNLVEGSPIQLVNGGYQKRCFTDIIDGIAALSKIIENKNKNCDGQIINIGNPNNEYSIKQLAKLLLESFKRHPLYPNFPPFSGFKEVESSRYYGNGYQDVEYRKPSISNAKRLINWNPIITMEQTIDKTLDFFLRNLDLSDLM